MILRDRVEILVWGCDNGLMFIEFLWGTSKRKSIWHLPCDFPPNQLGPTWTNSNAQRIKTMNETVLFQGAGTIVIWKPEKSHKQSTLQKSPFL